MAFYKWTCNYTRLNSVDTEWFYEIETQTFIAFHNRMIVRTIQVRHKRVWSRDDVMTSTRYYRSYGLVSAGTINCYKLYTILTLVRWYVPASVIAKVTSAWRIRRGLIWSLTTWFLRLKMLDIDFRKDFKDLQQDDWFGSDRVMKWSRLCRRFDGRHLKC